VTATLDAPARITAHQRALEALIGLVIDGGVEAVSVRHVATRAGVSIGAVQHHFPTREQMMVAAMEWVSSGVLIEVQRIAHESRDTRQAVTRICRMLAACDPDDSAAASVWVAFVAYAATNDAVRQVHRAQWCQLEGYLGQGLAALGSRDPDQAGLLLACLDGIAVARVTDPVRMPPERATRLVDDALASAIQGRRRS
jgi:AcrR family transcriptional regulator